MRLLVLIAACTSLLCLTADGLAIARGNSPSTFDYLMLSQEWPYSFCDTNSCKNTDKLLPLFNIHGLWPEHASSCHGQFNYSELKPLEDQLLKNWMDLKNPEGDPKEFWYHEYEKHGRCATDDSRYATTYLYFNAALQLHSKYILTEMLAKKGIVPGPNLVNASSIRDAVFSSFGYEPELSCVTKDQTIYLFELRLCFEKDLTPRNCTSSSRPHAGKSADGPLKYMESEDENSSASWSLNRRGKTVELIDTGSVSSGREGSRGPLRANVCSPNAQVVLPDKLGF